MMFGRLFLGLAALAGGSGLGVVLPAALPWLPELGFCTRLGIGLPLDLMLLGSSGGLSGSGPAESPRRLITPIRSLTSHAFKSHFVILASTLFGLTSDATVTVTLTKTIT